MSTVAGLQLPEIPFDELPGNTGTLVPAQIVSAVPKPNVGVAFGVTVTANVTCGAQTPEAGVKVYVPDA